MSFIEVLVLPFVAYGVAVAAVSAVSSVVDAVKTSSAPRASAEKIEARSAAAKRDIHSTVSSMDTAVQNPSTRQAAAQTVQPISIRFDVPDTTLTEEMAAKMKADMERQRKAQDEQLREMNKRMTAQGKELSEEQKNIRAALAANIRKQNEAIVQLQEKLMQDMANRFKQQADEIDRVRTELGTEVSKLSVDFTAQTEELREYAQKQLAAVRAEVSDIAAKVDSMVTYGNRHVAMAETYVDSAKGIYTGLLGMNFIHAGITEQEMIALAMAVTYAEELTAEAAASEGSTMANGAVAEVEAQKAFDNAATLQQKALIGTAQWTSTYHAAQAVTENAIDHVRKFTGGNTTNVKLPDKQGKMHETELDADKWSHGAISEILTTLGNIQSSLATGMARLSTEDLQCMITAAEALANEELTKAISSGVAQLYTAQYRSDLAIALLEKLEQNGYEIICPNTYIGDDHRQPNRIGVRTVDEESPIEAYVTFEPTDGGTGISMNIETKGCHDNPARVEKVRREIRETFKAISKGGEAKDDNLIMSGEEFRSSEKEDIDTDLSSISEIAEMEAEYERELDTTVSITKACGN